MRILTGNCAFNPWRISRHTMSRARLPRRESKHQGLVVAPLTLPGFYSPGLAVTQVIFFNKPASLDLLQKLFGVCKCPSKQRSLIKRWTCLKQILLSFLCIRKQLFHYNRAYPFGPLCMLTCLSPFISRLREKEKEINKLKEQYEAEINNLRGLVRQKQRQLELMIGENRWGDLSHELCVSLAHALSRAQSFSCVTSLNGI